jgi:hypothetical protein
VRLLYERYVKVLKFTGSPLTGAGLFEDSPIICFLKPSVWPKSKVLRSIRTSATGKKSFSYFLSIRIYD